MSVKFLPNGNIRVEDLRYKRITRIERIMELARQKRQIYCAGIAHKIPAAFIQNYQGRVLYNMVKIGNLYEVRKGKKHG